MNRRYGIGILLCMIVMCGAYSVSYRMAAIRPESSEQQQSDEEILTRPVTGSTDEKVYRYYLKDDNGYVAVYQEDQVTLYEHTSIRIETLPESLRQEIQQNKGLEDDHDLYNFLENYSS